MVGNHQACDIINLGSGTGYTVLEIIKTFEKISGIQFNYDFADRRPGDTEAIYANNDKAKKDLNWEPEYNTEDMLRTAWEWEKKLKGQ